MTGFDSKRQMAQDKVKKSEDLLEESVKALKAALEQQEQAKLDDDDDAQGYIAGYEAALKIAYEIGFANAKRSAQRKPLTATVIGNMMPSSIPMDHDGALMEFARAIEAAHGIKEGT